jgi:hypothetical protein
MTGCINTELIHGTRYTCDKIAKTPFTGLQLSGALHHRMFEIFLECQDFRFYCFALSDVAEYTTRGNGFIIYT